MLSELLDNGQQIPEKFTGKSFSTWEGQHPMNEFTLSSQGNKYYGCYYSPDDVPLAFQNLETELIADGDNSWSWKAEGDNKGVTSKIMDKWYYFEADF